MDEGTNTITGEKVKKILLVTPPFWSPLIPSQGIACLKGFLQRYGFRVTTVDMTAANELLEFYREYFETIKKFIPPEKRGNFYNIGHDVLRNHMMAYTNREDEKKYLELVKKIIYTTYYCPVHDEYILELTRIAAGFFSRLQDKFLDLLAQEKPSILGLTAHSGTLAAANFIFNLTRAHYPHIKTVMGGSIFFNHFAPGTPDLDLFLEKTASYIDKFIIGKGEILFLKWLRGEFPESCRVLTQADTAEEERQSYPLALPDLTDYSLDRYLYLAASGSSSCPYNCSFCNAVNFFGKFRKKNARQTVSEIKQLHEKYGHRLFFMTDSLLNLVITDITDEIIKLGLSIYLDGYFIVDDQSVDIENTLRWRQGGFYRARLGVESGSQHVLDMIGKRITPAKTKAAVASLAEAGIKTTTYWVIGHPGETEKDFQQTLQLLEEMRNDIWQAECNPFTFYYLGQGKENEWAKLRMPLYPGNANELLLCQTWVLDCEPCREEIYNRVFRFARRCQELGIPNPYSLDEIYKADERWKQLHKNAVPSIVDIMNNQYDLQESLKTRKILKLKPKNQEQGDFDF
jgi:hypothetical protein